MVMEPVLHEHHIIADSVRFDLASLHGSLTHRIVRNRHRTSSLLVRVDLYCEHKGCSGLF